MLSCVALCPLCRSASVVGVGASTSGGMSVSSESASSSSSSPSCSPPSPSAICSFSSSESARNVYRIPLPLSARLRLWSRIGGIRVYVVLRVRVRAYQ
ncbi:hypothetical protein K438DRAFT_1874590 [Mycena galopus ATCC 62051]|nr:hypothetical protein K438DRAFT_1874590 [Mycena galopus ATCC 62051]